MKPRLFPTPSCQPRVRSHETTDARVGWIFGVVFSLFLAGLAVHFVLSGVQMFLEKQTPPVDRWQARSSVPWNRRLPPLQIDPPVDLEALRARAHATLTTYGWVDRKAGLVRIPIARAMDLLSERGLAPRSSTNAPEVGPSSWQLIQGRRAASTSAETRP